MALKFLLLFAIIGCSHCFKLHPRSFFKTKQQSTIRREANFLEDWIANTFKLKPTEQKKKMPANGVLVFGATGKTGSKIISELMKTGQDVVAVSRNETKLNSLFKDYQKKSNFFGISGVDVTQPENFPENLFDGINQIILCLGPVFGNENYTSENIDFKAVTMLIDLFQEKIENLKNENDDEVKPIIDFNKGKRNLKQWSKIDDVIMGGKSSSGWNEVSWNGEGDSFCRYSGDLITDGGGFCGTTVKNINFNVDGFDGILLKVRGDGYRYKFRLKPKDSDPSDSTLYQAIFPTIKGIWEDIYIPFESFIRVKRTEVDYFCSPVNEVKSPIKGDMTSLGLMLSKFEFNKQLNAECTKNGKFQIDVENIKLYKEKRPNIVLISSAGTERINKIEDSARARDIPIMQLNPQGILFWKYKAEEHLRKAGIPYAIVRPSGLNDIPIKPNSTALEPAQEILTTPRRLQVNQGDSWAGRLTRDELAKVAVATSLSPYTVGKTFECRRDESLSGILSRPPKKSSKPSDEEIGPSNNWGVIEGNLLEKGDCFDSDGWEKQNLNRLFRSLVRDSDRCLATRGGPPLPPFPPAKTPTQG